MLWDAKYVHEEYHAKLFIVLMLIFFVYFTNDVFFMIGPYIILQTLVY